MPQDLHVAHRFTTPCLNALLAELEGALESLQEADRWQDPGLHCAETSPHRWDVSLTALEV